MRVSIQRAAVAAVAGLLIAGLAGGTVSAASSRPNDDERPGPIVGQGRQPQVGHCQAVSGSASASTSAGRMRPAPKRSRRLCPTRERLVRQVPDPGPVPPALQPDPGTGQGRPGVAPQPGLHRRLHPVEPAVRRGRRHRRPGCRGVQGVVRELPRRWADAPLAARARSASRRASRGRSRPSSGLDESAALVRPTAGTAAPPPDVFVNGQPCSTYWAEIDTSTPGERDLAARHLWQPDAICSVRLHPPAGPRRLRRAGCADRFRCHGRDHRRLRVADDRERRPDLVGHPRASPRFKPGQFSQIVAPGTYHRPQNKRQDPQGWSGEETLDIEAVHGMAPDAKVVYVGAPNNYQDLDAALNHVVDRAPRRHRDQLVRLGRRGAPEGLRQARSTTSSSRPRPRASASTSRPATAATRPVAIRPMRPPRPPTAPASDPWVTAVGGTSIGIGPNNYVVLETGWESGTSTYDADTNAWTPAPPGDYLYGGGGGTSHSYPAGYQAGVVPDSMSQAYGSDQDAGRPRRVRASATRIPASSSARPRRSPTGAPNTPSTGSVARASRRRSSPA